MRASTVTLTCLSAAAAASALWLGLQLSEERARVDVLSTELETLRHLRGTRPVEPGATPPADSATPRPTTTPLAAAPSNVVSQFDTGPEGPSPGARGRDSYEARRRLVNSPEYRKVMRAQLRLSMEQRYRDLPRALGLSPDKAAELFDLLTDQAMNNSEVNSRRVTNKQDALAQQAGQPERFRRQREELSAMLGASNLARFDEFQESMQSRSEVRMLGSELIGSSDPLREDQMEPLLNVMFTEQKRMQQEWSELMNTGVGDPQLGAKRSKAAIAANERIVDAARSLLSDKQLAALERMYRRQKLQMEAQDEMNRLQSEAMRKPTRGGTD